MAKQNLNYGSSPNDGTGDNLRNASIKIQSNFDELYARGLQEITDVNNETTNPIKLIDSGLRVELSSYVGQLLSFKPDTNGYKQYLGNTNVSNDRVAEFPDFDVSLNGCTPIDNFTNDITAAAGGIAIGQMYHTAGVVKIRLT